MLHEDLTAKIIEACFEVSNELGIGYIESVYEKALHVALLQKGLYVSCQVSLKVTFRGVIVGEFKADMVVDGKVILEIKAVDTLVKEHYAQVLNYIKATGFDVGMIINFGTSRLQYRRFDNRFKNNTSDTSALEDLLSSE